ncbi:MAG: hypothetical protein P4L92_17850 [Rudaea sp.]|nr:hypothetical protein [Rudaea sp.]
MAKITEVVISDSIRFSDHVTGTVTREGQTVGFTESLRDGRAAHGDLKPSGLLDHGFTGPPSKGEQGTLETCRMLVGILNEPVAQWLKPDAVSDDLAHIDCRAERVDGQQPPLDIQVVRAIADQKFWARIAMQGREERTDALNVAAAFLHRAIALKVDAIPVSVRSGIVLALNAIDAPALGFDGVVAAFHSAHGEWACQQGFAQIWIVGPNRQLTHKLA